VLDLVRHHWPSGAAAWRLEAWIASCRAASGTAEFGSILAESVVALGKLTDVLKEAEERAKAAKP